LRSYCGEGDSRQDGTCNPMPDQNLIFLLDARGSDDIHRSYMLNTVLIVFVSYHLPSGSNVSPELRPSYLFFFGLWISVKHFPVCQLNDKVEEGATDIAP